MVRGKAREEALLTATIQLLTSVGYEALTMDAVAAHARASKATLYRRWAGKAELVKAALDSLDETDNDAIPETGRLRSDLLAVMHALRDKASASYVRLLQDLVHAARRDPQLAQLLRAHTEANELSPFDVVLRRAIGKKQLSSKAPLELVHDVAEAMILRQLQLEAPFDDAFVLRVVDGVLLPLLAPHLRKAK